eukprot:INCI16002.1.p1 GENE.INCI16002.1~~INCI16002.1.p1  ORF type:complete len:482 (+),score=43.72 INCI16002.1:258-1703(+)
MEEHFGWQLFFYWHCFLAGTSICIVPLYFFLSFWGARRRLSLAINERPRPKEDLAGPISALLPGESSKRPLVSIITPVKATTNKTADMMDNFRSQILHAYNGRTENIYVFEDDQDPGVEMVKKLQQQHQGKHDIRIVYAGLAKTCSQKIHNLLVGVDAAHPSSEYVYFLDISTRCINSTLSRLVGRLEASNGECLAVSGYPLDLVPPGGGVFAWTMVQFRYVLMGFIGLKLDASYGWGGAMMLSKHRFDREKDPLKIRQIWTDGSVQDDMVLSSIAIENGLFVANVPHAVFFNELRQGISYATSFDFLRRQIFVAACYHSWTTRARHIAMLYAFTLLNMVAPLSHLVSAFAFMIEFGIIQCQYLELYPFARIMAYGILVAPFAIGFAEWMFVRTMARLYNVIAADDPAAPKFPLHRLKMSTIAYYVNAAMWISTWIGIYTVFNLGSIDWAGIRYTMKDGKVCRVTHIDARRKEKLSDRFPK